MFLIKEATLFRNNSYEVRCIIPDNLNNFILMIFKKIEDERKLMKIVSIQYLMKHFQYFHMKLITL